MASQWIPKFPLFLDLGRQNGIVSGLDQGGFLHGVGVVDSTEQTPLRPVVDSYVGTLILNWTLLVLTAPVVSQSGSIRKHCVGLVRTLVSETLLRGTLDFARRWSVSSPRATATTLTSNLFERSQWRLITETI